jgi:hypothetical protein
MDAFFLDLIYAARSLRRAKGFTLTVLLTFSVCIAANAALFAGFLKQGFMRFVTTAIAGGNCLG